MADMYEQSSNAVLFLDGLCGIGVWWLTSHEDWVFRRGKLIRKREARFYTVFVLIVPRVLSFVALISVVVFAFLKAAGISVLVPRAVIASAIAFVLILTNIWMFMPAHRTAKSRKQESSDST